MSRNSLGTMFDHSDVRTCCEEVTFAGHAFHLDARRALWWPERELLAIADIHFEKAKFFAGFGSLLPPHDTLDNLARLETLIADYQPRILLCLGDSFHRKEQAEALSPEKRFALLSLTRSVPDWHWIIGNHDRVTSLPFAGSIWSREEIGGITFLHGDGELPAGPAVFGHFHPKDSVHLRGRRVSGPCFMWNRERMILPAFGTFTGGMDLRSRELRKVIGEHPSIGLIHGTTVGCYRKE